MNILGKRSNQLCKKQLNQFVLLINFLICTLVFFKTLKELKTETKTTSTSLKHAVLAPPTGQK